VIVLAVVLSTSHTFQVCFSYIHLDILTFFSLLFFRSATHCKTKLGVLVFHPPGLFRNVHVLFEVLILLQVIRVNLRASKSNYFLSFVELWKDQKGLDFFPRRFFLSNR
jgi:hypothetical protein